MTPTQGEHAQTALAHELFAAAQLAPGEGIEDAVSRIAAALATTPVVPKVVLELPAGDTRTANVYWSEMRGDTLHLCISVDASAQPAGAALDVFGLKWPGEDRINLSTVFDTWEEATEYLDNRCDTPGILVVRLAAQPTPTAQAAPAGANVRRSDLVPGVMHCAKCKFQLNRVTLCVSDGNAYAGDNKTEPCPNGCGPLWPVTWEQEARNCWKTLEEMHERLQAAPAAGAVAGMPPGISALMCVISSLRDTAHFSDEEGELTDELRTLRDWAMTQAAAPTPAAQQREAGWQDISTAPKDGTRFVAAGYNYGIYSETRHTCIAQWFQGCWMEASDWNATSELKYLTHWMPLPPLECAARKQGGA